MQTEKILITEKEFIGRGKLYRHKQNLGRWDYHLMIRESVIALGQEDENGVSGLDERIIVTVMGTLCKPGAVLAESHAAAGTSETLILHLTEDWLMTLSAFALGAQKDQYRVFGRILTPVTPLALPFL